MQLPRVMEKKGPRCCLLEGQDGQQVFKWFSRVLTTLLKSSLFSFLDLAHFSSGPCFAFYLPLRSSGSRPLLLSRSVHETFSHPPSCFQFLTQVEGFPEKELDRFPSSSFLFVSHHLQEVFPFTFLSTGGWRIADCISSDPWFLCSLQKRPRLTGLESLVLFLTPVSSHISCGSAKGNLRCSQCLT